jgi:hypothetical protein
MSPATLSIVEWYAAGRRRWRLAGGARPGAAGDGLAFIIFVTSSIAFITYGCSIRSRRRRSRRSTSCCWRSTSSGVWQYLLSPKNRRKQEVIKEAVEEFEEQEKAEGRA